MVEIYNRIDELPSDLFSLKSSYLYKVYSLAESDIDSAIVLLGKAGERLAKGALQHFSIEFDEHDSFDALLRRLSSSSTSPTLVVGLRTVLKYRNQAAHDTDTALSIYDLEAAVSSFCAAYQSAYNLVEETASVIPAVARSMERVGPRIKGVDAEEPASFLDRIMAKLKIISLVTSTFLLLAVLRGGSSDFFLVLRVLVTFNAGLCIYRYYKRNTPLLLLFGGIALLFNPIVPVYFTREVWKIIDFAAMVVFVVTAFKIK